MSGTTYRKTTLRPENVAPQAITIEHASCSCGWSVTGDDLARVAGAAVVHRALHRYWQRRQARPFGLQHPQGAA